ncbi:MAG: M56 family metallopeptidase [Ruegeria sp.]|nr:M56 family metallopeptidase [Ruegeria sp.]
MTAVKPVLDAYLEWNLILGLAALIWLAARVVMSRTTLSRGFVTQLRTLKALCLCVSLSPVLALGVSALASHTPAKGTVAIGDIAVAAYLRGDIAMPATQFETLLNTRQRWVELLLSGDHPVVDVVLALLAMVSVAYAVRVLRDGLSIRETVNASFLWRRSAKVDIRLSDRIAVPFAVRGLRRRHVVLPSHLLDSPRELRFALAHELQHIRAGDVEWELGFELLRPLLFWNPAYVFLKYQFDRLRELACDQSVVARRGINAQDYTACLLDYCARTVVRGNPRVLNVALVTGGKAKKVLRQRVIALGDAPSMHRPLPFLFLGQTTLFALILGLAAASVQQTEDWSHDRLMLSTVVNLERLEARNQGN